MASYELQKLNFFLKTFNYLVEVELVLTIFQRKNRLLQAILGLLSLTKSFVFHVLQMNHFYVFGEEDVTRRDLALFVCCVFFHLDQVVRRHLCHLSCDFALKSLTKGRLYDMNTTKKLKFATALQNFRKQ